eukprot:TRINITY_DN1151_c0_g1_i1.p1 TRINITY_DN1151_c0_g1~~TRINITY_DN1151_c0_g1_i1.p1  ORF type:complete len:243 (+),score=59.99 TRINITY_DN1151_c0_g1_i1:291-1019(+)
MAQAVACSTHSCIPRWHFPYNSKKCPASRRSESSFLALNSSFSRSRFRVLRAATEDEECNEDACAPDKEVGKVSMEWLAEERTKVVGTFPPKTKRKWTGYIEKDTAGQTNVFSVEPTVYVSETAVSSGSAGQSSDGSENIAAISAGLALILIAGASSVLLQVGKNQPIDISAEYSGPPLSYYIRTFNNATSVSSTDLQSNAAMNSQSEAQDASSLSLKTDAKALTELQENREIPAWHPDTSL